MHGITDDDNEAFWRNMHIQGAYVGSLTFYPGFYFCSIRSFQR